jgi:hypothetical protein
VTLEKATNRGDITICDILGKAQGPQTASPGWLCALLLIPIALIFLVAMWKIACWSDDVAGIQLSSLCSNLLISSQDNLDTGHT